MFKSPIEYLKELIGGLVNDFANACFDLLKIFLFNETDFSKYPYVHELYNIVMVISVSLGVVFFSYNLLKILIGNLGGYNQRSVQEVVVKTVLAGFFSVTAPFIMTSVLIPINNAIVKMFLAKGLGTDTFAKFAVLPTTAATSLFVCAFVMVILFIILTVQSLIRIAELLIQLAISPLVAWSMINEDMNLFNIWWREVISTIFTQSFHIAVLWLAFNQIGDANSVGEFVIGWVALGFTLFVPKMLRKYLYSTGAGRSAVNVAGGAGKMMIYKLAARKLVA
ncbi:TPA: conjugal transfer protein TrbL family protein [Bacillus nitratireducens]